MATINRTLSQCFLYLIRGYRYFLSPLIPCGCRFYPTCSEYAASALRQYGGLKGTYFVLRRLLRCHPWHPGGIDFIPLKK